MNYSPEHRKEVGDYPCDSCDGTASCVSKVCTDCLGQRVLLTGEVYRTILTVAGVIDYADF